MSRIERELTGLTTPAGELDRPLHSASWRVPARFEVKGDELVWSARDGERRPVGVTAGPRMLKRFLALASADPDRVLAFAGSYGQLHWPVMATYGAVSAYADEGSEPLEWWRILAREAGAVLDIAAAIRNPRGAAIPSEMWERFETLEARPTGERGFLTVSFEPLGPIGLSLGAAVMDPQQILATYVGGWFGSVGVGFAWSSRRNARVILSPGGVVGALGLQLAQVLAGTDGLAVTCKACGQSFAPGHGNQRYCKLCRDLKEPQLRATKAYRARRAGAARAQ